MDMRIVALGVSAGKERVDDRSSAHSFGIKLCSEMGSMTSQKKQFHNEGPKTVPWKTGFSRVIGEE